MPLLHRSSVSPDERRKRKAAAARSNYARKGSEARRLSRVRVAEVRAVRGPLVDQIKLDRGCVDCGYSQHPSALHFDHRDPSTKSFSISKALTRSWESILAEIGKCDVRCANCHTIRGVKEGHLGRPRIDGHAVVYNP